MPVLRMLRRAICALLLIAFSGIALAENHYCVSTEKGVFLVSEDGGAINLTGAWSDIYCVRENELYAIGLTTDAGTRYALSDASGRLLTEPAFTAFAAALDGVLFCINGAYGWKDASGQTRVTADYTQIVCADENAFYGLLSDPNDDEPDQIYLVNVNNESTATSVWTASPLSAPSGGRMPYCDPETRLYGYLDLNGNIAIEARFTFAGDFSGGAAHVAENGKHGLIDASGEWLVPAEYDYIASGDGFILALRENSLCAVYASDGKNELFRIEESGVAVAAVGDAIVIANADSLRIYDSEGTLRRTCPANTSVVAGASGQLILSEGDWGSKTARILDKSGIAIDRVDQHLIPLDDARYAFVEMNVALYNSDLLGGKRYSVDYDSLKMGMIDRTGREIIPAEYEEIRRVGEDRYLLIGDRELRICDGEGTNVWKYLLETATTD